MFVAAKRSVSVLGLRPDGLHGLRAEPAILSFLLMPPVTAFSTMSFDASKSRALRLDAFNREEATRSGASYQGSVSRRLGI